MDSRIWEKCVLSACVCGLAVYMMAGCVSGAPLPSDADVHTAAPAQDSEETDAEAADEIVMEDVSPEISFAENIAKTLRTGTLNEAILLFEDIPAEIKDTFDFRLMYVSLLVSAGRLAEAAPLAEGLLKESPDNPDVLMLSSMIAKQSGDEKKKTQILKQLLKEDPSNTDANVELGNEQMLRHNYKQARQYYQKGLSGDKNNPSALLGYGQASYYLGDMKSARKAFNTILKRDGTDAYAWAYLGKLEAEDGNYAKAVGCIEKAIEYNSSVFDFWMDYGSYLRRLGRYDDAEKAWLQAVSVNPDYFLGHAYLAGLYDERNIFDKAFEEYLKVVQLNPKYYFAYESLGMFAWHQKDYKAARDAFSKAFEVIGNDSSKNISYPLMIAATYMAEGRKKDCQDYMKKALRNMDTSTASYAVMRLYYDGLGVNNVIQKVLKESNRNTRGKLLFYIGLYYELNGNETGAKKYYNDVRLINSPMFFEYRLAEWGLESL